MKKVFFSLCLLAAISGKAQKTSITVEVENFRNEKGVCRAYLFDDDKSFPSESDKAVASKSVKINGSKATLTFENVPTGTYAIAIIHDENNNNTLDANFIGIPKEGFGASKNVLPSMSKPLFKDNAFKVSSQPVKLVVKLRY
jgi:uncharacterized protein (DUF2141 family)